LFFSPPLIEPNYVNELTEYKEYSEQDPIYTKPIACVNYEIIFDDPTDAKESKYEIINKNGKRVGTLRYLKGFLIIDFIITFQILFWERWMARGTHFRPLSSSSDPLPTELCNFSLKSSSSCSFFSVCPVDVTRNVT